MSPGRVVVSSVVAAIVVLLAGTWLLNSTRVGVDIRCGLLNDVGACFLRALSEPAGALPVVTAVPRRTESPHERAARHARERQARLDEDVTIASAQLLSAVDDVRSNAGVLDSAARSVDDSVDTVAEGVRELRNSRAQVEQLARARSGDFWEDDLAIALDDVKLAHEDVVFALDTVASARESYDEARRERGTLEGQAGRAVARLRTAVEANPGGRSPAYAEADATAALAEASKQAASAERKMRSALERAERLRAEAGRVLREAEELVEQATAN